MEKVANGEGIAQEQRLILMLKAQANHFAYLRKNRMKRVTRNCFL